MTFASGARVRWVGGVSVASELILTGRFIAAERALAVGLVSEVVEDDALGAAAEPYVEAMLAASPLGLRLSEECLNVSVDAASLEAVIAMEDRNQVLTSAVDLTLVSESQRILCTSVRSKTALET